MRASCRHDGSIQITIELLASPHPELPHSHLLAALLVLAGLAAVHGGVPTTTYTSAIDCSPVYPIDSSALIFDFDINCNVNTSTAVLTNWTSKVNGYSANLSLPQSAVVADAYHQTLTATINFGRKVTIPVDISPSNYPVLTLEYLVSGMHTCMTGVVSECLVSNSVSASLITSARAAVHPVHVASLAHCVARSEFNQWACNVVLQRGTWVRAALRCPSIDSSSILCADCICIVRRIIAGEYRHGHYHEPGQGAIEHRTSQATRLPVMFSTAGPYLPMNRRERDCFYLLGARLQLLLA